MVSSCLGTSGKVCNGFLPAKDKDLHLLCVSCRGKECPADDHCDDCHG